MIDFSKIRRNESEHSSLDPRDVFNLLPRKAKNLGYLRDVQNEVLEKWYSQRSQRNSIVAMNTGSGKTIVGLLILKSCLNENKGPAVYVAPDKYLSRQVMAQAEELGIEITDDPDNLRFRSQQAVLVTNIHKVFNGRSVFGVGTDGIRIEIGSIVIDDVHACVDRIEDQFTLKFPQGSKIYDVLLSLFKSDMESQSPSLAEDIVNSVPYRSMLLPYWSIQDRVSDVIHAITRTSEHDESTSNEVTFKYPLLKDHLRLADCVVSSERIEFSLRVIPISVINSFEAAERRVFLSATLPESGVAMTHLGISPDELINTITPSTASDLGERMILIPEAVDPELRKADIKALLKKKSSEYNTVVIVPSHYRAQAWEDIADRKLTADNLESGIEELRNTHVGLVVVVNKYDGIDLPEDACRILVVDELPDDQREIEKIESNILRDRGIALDRKIRKIEQGMGRGIRSNEDYCVVILMGKSLTHHLYARKPTERFTPGTEAQVSISDQVTNQIASNAIHGIEEAIGHVLERNVDWISANREALLHTKYAPIQTNKIAEAFLKAFKSAARRDHHAAIEALQEAANAEDDPTIKGWLKYYLAVFQNALDPVESRVILKSALQSNSRLPAPIEGIEYTKIRKSEEQAELCARKFAEYADNTNQLLLEVETLLSEIEYVPDNSNRFEEAIKNLASFIGFVGQRPENDFKRGPDVLWAVGQLVYFVIECKSSATSDLISKRDVNQLNGSIEWFKQQYDQSCNAYPVMLHPRSQHDVAATPAAETRIVTSEKLSELKSAISKLISASVSSGRVAHQSRIAELLVQLKLDRDSILSEYSVPPTTQ